MNARIATLTLAVAVGCGGTHGTTADGGSPGAEAQGGGGGVATGGPASGGTGGSATRPPPGVGGAGGGAAGAKGGGGAGGTGGAGGRPAPGPDAGAAPDLGGMPIPAAQACGAYAPGTELHVCTATFLGGPMADEGTATAVGPGRIVVVGGVFAGADFGKTPVVIGAGGPGAVLRFDGKGKPLSVTRLGARVADLAVNSMTGEIVACGDFGVALLDKDAAKAVWSKSGAVDRCDVGSDGTVAALGKDRQTVIYDGKGDVRAMFASPEQNAIDVAVEPATGTVAFAGWTQKNVKGFCLGELQVAALYAYGYDGMQRWKDYGFSAQELAPNGSGDCADTRAHIVTTGRDGFLYFVGHSAGGNSMFGKSPRSASMPARNVSASGSYNSPFNMHSEHISYYTKIDPKDGTQVQGQFLLARRANNSGNTLVSDAIFADAKGVTYVAGVTDTFIAQSAKLTISGITAPAGGFYVEILSPDWKQQMTWTNFGGGAGHAYGVAAGDGVVAVVGTSAATNATSASVTYEPLQPARAGDAEAFLAVFPGP